VVILEGNNLNITERKYGQAAARKIMFETAAFAGLIGTRTDIKNSQGHARAIRAKAEKRAMNGEKTS